jgi:hypothetical protein
MAIYSPSCRGSATLSVEPDIDGPAATGAARRRKSRRRTTSKRMLILNIPTNILFMTA